MGLRKLVNTLFSFAAVVRRAGLIPPEITECNRGSNLKNCIRRITLQSYKEETHLIEQKTLAIPEADRSKFRETIETELISMHPGNIARYSVRPLEFEAWKNIWGQQVIMSCAISIFKSFGTSSLFRENLGGFCPQLLWCYVAAVASHSSTWISLFNEFTNQQNGLTY